MIIAWDIIIQILFILNLRLELIWAILKLFLLSNVLILFLNLICCYKTAASELDQAWSVFHECVCALEYLTGQHSFDRKKIFSVIREKKVCGVEGLNQGETEGCGSYKHKWKKQVGWKYNQLCLTLLTTKQWEEYRYNAFGSKPLHPSFHLLPYHLPAFLLPNFVYFLKNLMLWEVHAMYLGHVLLFPHVPSYPSPFPT